MSLGEAQVPVRLTLDKLDRDLNQARGKIDGALGKIGGGLQSLGKVALLGIATGVAAVGGAMAVAGKHAIQLGADAGETASLLETSLGPAAAGLNSELREFATNANRSFFELQEGSATFVAMTKSMGATEQQAADLGVGFTTAATDLGSFFNVPTEQSLMDIQGALAGSSETLQKYGIDVRETTLKQMALDQGLISTASETIPRLDRAMLIQQAITEQAADAMGDAERTSGSWQNVMRGLQGRLKDTATEIGMKLIPALEPLLGKFLDLTDNVLAKLLPILEDVIEVFGQFIENIIGGSEPISALTGLIWNLLGAFGVGEETATSITETFFTLADGARTLWNRITALLAPVIEAIGSFVSWKDVLIGLGVAIASVVIPIIISIAGAVAPVIAAFVLVTAAVAVLRNAWENNFQGIQEKTQAAIKVVQQIITTALSAITNFWDAHGELIISIVTGYLNFVVAYWTTILNAIWTVLRAALDIIVTAWDTHGESITASAQQIWNTVQSVIETVVGVIQSIITSVTGQIESSWDAHGEGILASAQRFWTAVSGFIEGIISGIQAIIVAVATAIQGFWESHGASIVEGAQTAWGFVLDIIDTSMASIRTLFDTFAALFSGDWEAFGQGILDLWQASIDNIVAAFDAIWSFISPILSGLWSDISGWFGGKVSEFAAIGLNLITALADAISTRANNYLKSAAQGVANLLPGWVKALLGITSPSTVFRDIGHDIVDGLIQGIRDEEGNLEDAVGQLFGFIGELSNIGGTIGSIFKARELDPLESRLDSTTTAIDEVTKSVNESLSELGISDIAGFTGQDRADLQLRLMRSGYRGLANDIAKLTNLRSQEVRLADELAEKEQKLLDLQEQQQDLKLLEAQQRLLDLIRENNLSTSILDGLQLGLQADLGSILEATSAAMKELIGITEQELGIASPSKRFMRIGEQIMAGLERGMNFFRPQFDLDRMLPVMTPGDVGRPIENRSVHYNPVTTVQTNRDPMRVLRASRHLDKLGRL